MTGDYREFLPWFIFGEYPGGKFVDVADIEGDIRTGVTRAKAEELIAEQDLKISKREESSG